jgi:hypothetical protein
VDAVAVRDATYLRRMPQPFAFHDLPSSAFPFEIIIYDKAGRTLWRTTVDCPGAVKVPAFPGRVGGCRITYPDGKVEGAV